MAALLIASGISAASVGCSDAPVNIGDTHTQGDRLSDYAAVWDGYAQAFSFGDGSDHLRVTIDASGQGTFVVGDSAPPPPPTDPAVGYPAGYRGMFSTGAGVGPPLPGYPYPIHAAEIQSERIQLGVDFRDFYSAWCALETSYPHSTGINGPDEYGCMPEVSKIDPPEPDSPWCTVTYLDGTSETLDCGMVSLCVLESMCTCTASSCSAALVPAGSAVSQYQIWMDAALDDKGSTLTGTLGGSVNIIIKKQP